MTELLLELFSEEIPSKMQSKMAKDLQDIISAKLTNAGIIFKHINHYFTPRRIAIAIDEMEFQKEDMVEEKRGPKIDAPINAIDGFAKSSGLEKSQLIEKNGHYFAFITKKAKNSASDIAHIINQSISSLVWPKSMRWNNYSIRWARPLKNILCIYDNQILDVGFGHLTANDKSWGHRCLGAEFKVELANSFADYMQKLRDNFVILDANERRKIILDQANNICDSLNISLKLDESLLSEVIGLVEYPVVLPVKIDPVFMSIPAEVLVTSVKTHQKYFSTQNIDGSLAPYCLIVANNKTKDDGKMIISGNERVLRARLSDADFFYQQDLKIGLDQMGSGLDNIIFHSKIGTISDKISHMLALTSLLGGDQELLTRAIKLCKNDLVSQMVGEFPSLQGIMGYYYAKSQNEPEIISCAIRDHYKPISSEGDLPNDLGALVAISDKITNIVFMFFADEKPTSSKDPFALRRASIGIIRIIIANKLPINIRSLIITILERLNGNLEIADEIILFFKDRFRQMLKDQNITHDIIESVIDHLEIDDVYDCYLRIAAINEFISSEQGKSVLAMYKRINNIIIAAKDYKNTVNTELFEQEIEKQLFDKINQVSDLVTSSKEYITALNHLNGLVSITATFFDQILINVENQDVRNNRLSLITSIVTMMNKIANFSVIEGQV